MRLIKVRMKATKAPVPGTLLQWEDVDSYLVNVCSDMPGSQVWNAPNLAGICYDDKPHRSGEFIEFWMCIRFLPEDDTGASFV